MILFKHRHYIWLALENFNPNWPFDPTRWMPLGVLHDLMDERVDIVPNPNVIDNVSGYTQ
jgi:hypothetical protein